MKTKVIKINSGYPEEKLIEEAAEVLRNGGLVAFPTETVYGIGANHLDERAINRLYKVKKRPRSKPFTIAIAKFETLEDLKIRLSEKAEKIIHKFWPGPLTILAHNDKKEKIGIRMPANKIALEIIGKANIPVALPSANLSGQEPAISGREATFTMSGRVDMIVDGGFTEIGRDSTILDVTTDPFSVVREGAISKEDLVTDFRILFVCTGNSCRSVMAKGILEKLIGQASLSEKVKVDSAGTGGFEGIAAAPNTVQVMKDEGIDVSAHRGKGITPELLKKSDIIIVMERHHRDIILTRAPEISPKVRLLKEGEGIPDPIGKSIDEYRRILDMIKEQTENIFLELFKKRN